MPKITLTTRYFDESAGKTVFGKKDIDTEKVAIVAIDTWNFHYCKTFCATVGSMIPRFNAVFDAARKLGIKIVFAPTTAAQAYSGHPQRERAVYFGALHELPEPVRSTPEIVNEPVVDACGKLDNEEGFNCMLHYGILKMDDNLKIADEDFITGHPGELWSICKEYGIETLIHVGFATNMCLVNKGEGIRAMVERDMDCVFARDLTAGITTYIPERNFTPTDGTRESIKFIEKNYCPSICIEDELRKLGLWPEVPVDMVNFAPWGTINRPYTFEKSTTVSMAYPFKEGAAIRYTLDGSVPDIASALYAKPFKLSENAVVKSAAFDQSGKQISAVSESHYIVYEEIPPKPDVYLSDIEPEHARLSQSVIRLFPDEAKIERQCWLKGYSSLYSEEQRYCCPPPQMDASYTGAKIIVRGKVYEKGIGVCAPSHLVYLLKPEYRKIVGLGTVDETMMKYGAGRETAAVPSVEFKIYIDGVLTAKSSIMRVGELPWRFNLDIPRGSRTISLAVTDAGDGNKEDIANWVNIGFICKSEGL